MNRLLLWITTAVLGAAATLITSIEGLLRGVLFLGAGHPLIVRGDHPVALSWLLTARWPEQRQPEARREQVGVAPSCCRTVTVHMWRT
jgi:hypothetical protein